MTTGLQLALLGGVIAGAGLALLLWRLVPAQPDLGDVVRRYSEGSARGTRAVTAAVSTNTTERLGVWALKRLPNSWWGRTPTKDLLLLQIPVHRHYGKKMIYFFAGLIIPPGLGYFLIVLDYPIPFLIPVAGSAGMALGMWFLPDVDARNAARKARTEFSRAMGAYIDLVALERLAGSGPRQSMERAAEVGDSWVFVRIREELARSRWSGQQPWDALQALAADLDLPELDDLADIMRLSKDGSQVYTNLRSRSSAMRSAVLNEDLAKANAIGERMSMPMSGLGVVFMVILITPALLRIFIGG